MEEYCRNCPMCESEECKMYPKLIIHEDTSYVAYCPFGENYFKREAEKCAVLIANTV